MFLVTPIGNLANLATGVQPVVRGNTVIWGDLTETFESTAAAILYYNWFIYLLKNFPAGSNFATAIGGGFISSINPDPFICSNANALVINGAGFQPPVALNGNGIVTNTYKIYIDDANGGVDTDGYYFNCTYASPTKLTAVYGGPGDSNLPDGNCLVTLINNVSNAYSNTLLGTVASLTVTL